MRARRKRCRISKARSPRLRSTHTLEGVTTYRHSNAGRHARIEALGVQRERQGSRCALCGEHLELGDSKFESPEFREGVENRVVHKIRCVQE